MSYIGVVLVAVLLGVLLWLQLSTLRHRRDLEGQLAPPLNDFVQDDVLQHYERIVLYFYDPQDTLCRSLRDVAADLKGRYPNFIPVDVVQTPKISERFSIEVVPVFVVITKGMVLKVLVGQQPVSQLEGLFSL
jgi:thioredoxin-like negative regulator of GroEL